MPECEICGEDVETVYRCKNCDASFCEYCGSRVEKLCIDCLDKEEVSDEDEP
jgi:hypothetical protein